MISAYSRNDAWRSVLELSLDITRKSPRKARVWNDLGNAFDDLDRFDDALPAYRKAIELDPFFQRAHYNQGLAFFGNHRFREAEQEFESPLHLTLLIMKLWNICQRSL
jgi:Flp pilus assembly protein TadD